MLYRFEPGYAGHANVTLFAYPHSNEVNSLTHSQSFCMPTPLQPGTEFWILERTKNQWYPKKKIFKTQTEALLKIFSNTLGDPIFHKARKRLDEMGMIEIRKHGRWYYYQLYHVRVR